MIIEGRTDVTVEVFRFHPLVNDEACLRRWLSSDAEGVDITAMELESAANVPFDDATISVGWRWSFEGTKPYSGTDDVRPFGDTGALRVEGADFTNRGTRPSGRADGFVGDFEIIEEHQRWTWDGEMVETDSTITGSVMGFFIDCPDPALESVESQEELGGS